MIDLGLNFDELEHMSLEDAQKLVSQFNPEEYDWKVDGLTYTLDILRKDLFHDDNRHEEGIRFGVLCVYKEYRSDIVKRFDIILKQCVEKRGLKRELFKARWYEVFDLLYHPFEIHSIIRKEIPPKVIPGRTITTFGEDESFDKFNEKIKLKKSENEIINDYYSL